MVSFPPSLKRTRTSKVLGEKGFEINWVKWTIAEACLLETVESFLCTTNVPPTYQNITKLYNFLVNSNCVCYLRKQKNKYWENLMLSIQDRVSQKIYFTFYDLAKSTNQISLELVQVSKEVQQIVGTNVGLLRRRLFLYFFLYNF